MKCSESKETISGHDLISFIQRRQVLQHKTLDKNVYHLPTVKIKQLIYFAKFRIIPFSAMFCF